MSTCGSCNPCENNCGNTCCKQPCLRWGFDGCFLRGRCADGSELDPLNLCEWLEQHETCTDFRLVVDTTNGGYMQFTNECKEVEKIFVCDFLSLGNLECIGNVYDKTPASPCDLMVFDPSCGDEGDPRYNKWSHYTIPDAGDCVMQPDSNGYFKVLTKNDCGCIKECNLFAQSTTWEYALRDSWPDDPDWPFTNGSLMGDDTEIIDLLLDQKIPLFGSVDLEVTVQYAYGVQNYVFGVNRNFKSTVTPTKTPTHTPSLTDVYTKSIVLQGSNLDPWGSWEWQASRTFIVPKGQKLYLTHEIQVHDANGNIMDSSDNTGASRLHALHVFVRATKGVQL